MRWVINCVSPGWIATSDYATLKRKDHAQHPAGRVGDAETATFDGGQTSHKAGSRSIEQKQDEARYPDRSMPSARKTSGAFGKEPQD